MKVNSDSNSTLLKFFGPNQNLVQASSPGRMDVIGGIADYSGSLVLQKSIAQKATVTITIRNYNQLHIKTLNLNSKNELYIDLDELPTDYESAKSYLKNIEGGDWASYIIGCYLVLCNEKKIKLGGLDILVQSDVPVGKGVSSSAALEVATLKALTELYKIELVGTELPRFAQMAENLVVGAPCGLMDQLASYFGNTNNLLPILCQPDVLHELVEIPENLHFFGIDSGVKHAVSGASYGEVRTAAFMGYSIIAQKLGITKKQLETSNSKELPFNGFLSNISPSKFESDFARSLNSMYGKDFIHDFGVVTDKLSVIKPDSFYNIKACTKHPIYENYRVNSFKQLLKSLSEANYEEILPILGELMYQAHESYNNCGLGNEMTDKIVSMARNYGPENGIYGAKITGGGSGGTVCLMAYGPKGLNSAKQLFAEYKKISSQENLVFFE
ncbi:GHMP kinase [Emticicia oligotrophica DSM 17448]|uniref:GHMP kinase n=1 Tax=Emticicia oligotrophica (strain DSM 17448 / CIP 109782 / MTCC 6937 / GPTSA100-15) TaxID=929562 RepID=A0ABN4ATL4_EMTOG|nr:GHMP kinase [Emticicia oligotrophica]AFK05245.1 GHMP kinase [Emticicia oligotrophica DSM 17448]